MLRVRVSLFVIAILALAGTALASSQEYFEQVKAAIRRHDLAKVRSLVAQDPSVLLWRDDTGNFTLLHIAAMNGDPKMASFLLSKRLDPNAIDAMRMTPVRWAVLAKSAETLKELADAGADLHTADSLDYLLDDAIGLEDVKVVEYLLSKRFSPDFYSTNVNLPLVSAAWVGNIEIIKRLLAAGAHINLQGTQGESALSTACARAKHDVLKFLLEHGADPNGSYPIAADPLVGVLKMDDVPCFKLLMEHSYDLHKQQEVPPICALARFCDDTTIGNMMLQKHADLNSLEKRSSATAIQLAVRYAHHKVLRWLIDHGARMDNASADTDEPFTLALKLQDVESMRLLQSRKR